jgi:hypothetical protein
VFALLMAMLGLPGQVAELTYGAVWLLLPWPAAIGYRRFLHGVLIRSGRTRVIALGTALRLAGMAGTALALYAFTQFPGAWVGAASLSAGVCIEALATRIMAISTLRQFRTGDGATPFGRDTGYRDIARFYLPLALTSFIGLVVNPLLTFFMGRSPSPVASLAVFPVVHALSFLFRSLGYSYQEAAIALLGRRFENTARLGRFGWFIALVSSGAMALVAFTPLAELWFGRISGLPPDLTALAITAARLVAPLPAVAVLLSLQQAILVQGRRTRAITIASAVQVAAIAALFPWLGWGLGMTGVSAAMLALLAGTVAATIYLRWPVRRILQAHTGAPAR